MDWLEFFRGLAQSQRRPDRRPDFYSARAPVGHAPSPKGVPPRLVDRHDLSVRERLADGLWYLTDHRRGTLVGSAWVVPPPVRAAVADQPYWLQIVEIIVLADLGLYFAHRMFHAVPCFGGFTRSITVSRSSTGWRPPAFIRWIRLQLKGFHWLPVVALGFSEAAIVVFAVLYQWQSILIHSNVRICFGPLRWLSHRHNFITGITAKTTTRATRISPRNYRCWISCSARRTYLAAKYLANTELTKPCLGHTSPSCFTRLRASGPWLPRKAGRRTCAGRHQCRNTSSANIYWI